MERHLLFALIPRLVASKESVLTKLRAFWELIKYVQLLLNPLILRSGFPFDSAVLDLAFVGDERNVVKLIEVNPYNNYEGAGTGGSLFSWSADRAELEDGSSVSFRILTEQPSLQGRIPPELTEMLSKAEFEASNRKKESCCVS